MNFWSSYLNWQAKWTATHETEIVLKAVKCYACDRILWYTLPSLYVATQTIDCNRKLPKSMCVPYNAKAPDPVDGITGHLGPALCVLEVEDERILRVAADDVEQVIELIIGVQVPECTRHFEVGGCAHTQQAS